MTGEIDRRLLGVGSLTPTRRYRSCTFEKVVGITAVICHISWLHTGCSSRLIYSGYLLRDTALMILSINMGAVSRQV
jgi:hypothetical protein